MEKQRTYHDLFSLRKVVSWVSIQLHLTQLGDGNVFLGNNLGGVEKVEAKSKLIVFVHDLNTELWAINRMLTHSGDGRTYLPLRIAAGFDSIIKILTHIVRILARHLLCLLPHKAGLALKGLPVEFDQLGVSAIGDQTEGVHTEAVEVSEGPGNAVAGHCPQKRVQSTGLLAEEVPSRVMRRRRLRDLVVASRLHCVDQVGELDGILNEKHRDVVADNICISSETYPTRISKTGIHTKVSFVGIEASRKTVNIASGIGTSTASGDSREANEDGGFFVFRRQERSSGDI